VQTHRSAQRIFELALAFDRVVQRNVPWGDEMRETTYYKRWVSPGRRSPAEAAITDNAVLNDELRIGFVQSAPPRVFEQRYPGFVALTYAHAALRLNPTGLATVTRELLRDQPTEVTPLPWNRTDSAEVFTLVLHPAHGRRFDYRLISDRN
jgi:hypothetical protein